MKSISTLIVTIILISMMACQENERDAKVETLSELKAQKENLPDIADAEFKDGMVNKAFHNYLEIGYALVESDLEEAQDAAENLADSFQKSNEEIRTLASSMTELDDIEDFRMAYATITEKLEPVFKEYLKTGTIYLQHCPMAFDNQGANWISDVPEIKNPYFGDKMLNCGENVESINGKEG